MSSHKEQLIVNLVIPQALLESESPNTLHTQVNWFGNSWGGGAKAGVSRQAVLQLNFPTPSCGGTSECRNQVTCVASKDTGPGLTRRAFCRDKPAGAGVRPA